MKETNNALGETKADGPYADCAAKVRDLTELFTGILSRYGREKSVGYGMGSRFSLFFERNFSLIYSRDGNKGVLRFFLHSLFHVLYFHRNVKKELL